MNQTSAIERQGWRTLLISMATLVASTFCFSAQSWAACGNRAARTIGEYALSAGVVGTAPSSGSQQGTGLLGVGLGIFVNPRVEVEGDLLFTGQGSIGGAGQIDWLPFRDAFTTGCLIPYLAAGGAGDSDYLYEGPSVGGGFKYYYGSGVGLGLDARAVFPQAIQNSSTVFKGTVYMVTLRLLFEPKKD